MTRDVRQIPHYWRCERHGDPDANTGPHGDGLDCAKCADERDAAVDGLVEAALAVLWGHAKTCPPDCEWAKLREALAKFGVEP